jgi:hypothetical protein
VNIAPIASHAYPLARSSDAFEDANQARGGLLKAMIYPDGAVPSRQAS